MTDKLNCLPGAPALESDLHLQLVSGINTLAAEEILHKYYTDQLSQPTFFPSIDPTRWINARK